MQTQTSNPTISETIAAMDAVDAARNAEELLNDEINIEERKGILREKLKSTYAANNINVSDDIINKGVNDFFANRYSFRKMPRSLTTLFAWSFVKRAVLMRWTAAFVVISACCFAVVMGVKSMQQASKQRAIEKQLADKKAEQTKIMLGEKQALAKKAAEVAELAGLGLQLKTVGDTIQKIAKEPAVISRADNLVTEGLAAVKVADLVAGRKAHADLKGILTQLTQEYQVIIQQSPKTALWRVLDRNPNIKRYYVIVNAVDASNNPVQVSIKSEEDSTTKLTSNWAEQVPQALYESLKLEKETRGVLTNRLFAEKSKGYMQPVYKQGMKTNAGADMEALRITKW